jgi:hypothetical protein
MKFDFYVSLLSEKYKNGKMNLIKAFDWFESNRRAKQNFEYSSHIYVIKTVDNRFSSFKEVFQPVGLNYMSKLILSRKSKLLNLFS